MNHESSQVTHVGPALDAKGGISSVLSSLAREGCFDGYDVRFRSTVDGSKGFVRQLRGISQTSRVALEALHSKRGIYHLHVASRGSFYRKALIFAAAKMRGHITVIHLHGAQFHHFAEASGLTTRTLVRWTFSAADAVLVLSPEWQTRVREFSGRPDSRVVPNPVRVPRDASTTIEDLVVFLGRLGARKGVYDLLDAIDRLQQSGNRTTCWVIAGDGDTEACAQRARELPAPQMVTLPGWLDRGEVEAALSKANVFCLPSYDEGKPIALLEAMAYGRACVATPVGGVPDLIANEVNGLLVEPGDVASLAGALERCIGDEALRSRLGAAARETVVQTYSVESVSRCLVAIYDELAR